MAAIGVESEGKMADVTIEEIRTWWKVPAIAHFCSLFRATFSLPDFEIEELEEALFLDAQEEMPSPFLNELLVTLLRGCYQRKDIDHHNHLGFLRDTLKYRWETEERRVNPLRNEDATFKNLSTLMKVEILNALCDYRLDAPDVSNLKDYHGEHLRIEPLGKDGSGALYWYFYGTRLYKEDREPTKQEKDAKRKERLKEKKKKLRELQAARRKLNQKEKQQKKEKPKKEKQPKGKRKKTDESESDEDADDEETKSKKGGGGKKGTKTPQKSKAKKGDADSGDEEEKVTPKKRGGKKTQATKDEEEESPKKQNRKRKPDAEENEDKTDKTKKRGRQPKKEEEKDASPRKRGGTPKKQSKDEEKDDNENERTKKKGVTPKKGAKEKEVTPNKRGGKNSKTVQTNASGKDEVAVSADEESDNQPLAKLKDSPTKSEDGTIPKKRGRGKQVKEEEESPQPKKRGRTPKKEKEEEEEKAPVKRSRAKKVKEETDTTPKKGQQKLKEETDTTPKKGQQKVKEATGNMPKKGQQKVKAEPKCTQTSPRGKKFKEELKTDNDTPSPDDKKGAGNDVTKEEACEDANTDEASTAPSTATSIPVSSEESSDDDLENKPRWHLVCHTEEDWEELTEKLKKSRLKCERELYKLLVNDFLPEIKALFVEKERELRKRLLEMAPKRVSDRIVTLRIKQEEEEKRDSEMKQEAEARRKAFEQARQARRERARSLQQKQDTEQQAIETTRRVEARAKRARLREKRLEYIREGKEIPEELQKEFDTNSAMRWKSRVDDDEEETYLGLIKVLDTIKTHPDSWPFLEEVSESYAPGYYNVVKYPMDLTTMERKLNDKVYSSKDEFVNDMHQIFQNCVDYNGPTNEYTIMAETLENVFDESMDDHFPDDEDESETDDDEFTSAAYYRELRGIRRTPLRHTTRNTSASRAKMEMSVHTMMQSSSAESSPHGSDYSEYDGDGEKNEANENDEIRDGLENGDGSDVSQKDKDNDTQGSIFRQQTKNFQQGFEQFVQINSPPNSITKPSKSKNPNSDPKSQNNSVTNEMRKKRAYARKKSKSEAAAENADNKEAGDAASKEGGVVTKSDSQSNESNSEDKGDPSKTVTSGEQEDSKGDPSKGDPSKGDPSKGDPSKGDTTKEQDSRDNPSITDNSAQDNNSVAQNGVIEKGNMLDGNKIDNSSGIIANAQFPSASEGGNNAKEPERKKRKYTKRSPKWAEMKNKTPKGDKTENNQLNAAEQSEGASQGSNVNAQTGDEPKPEKKKRQYKKKEPKEGADKDGEKKTRKRRTKKEMKEAENTAAAALSASAKENDPFSPPDSDADNNNFGSSPGSNLGSHPGSNPGSGRVVNSGGQQFVLHKVDCEPGKFSPSIDGHEAKIIRVPNPMHSANRGLLDGQSEQSEPHDISLQTDNPPPSLSNEEMAQRHEHSQMQGQENSAQMNPEWGGEPPKPGSVLGQFLNPQEHNFLQGGNIQQQHSSESYSRDGSVSSEQFDGPQRPPPMSNHNFVPQSSPPYYPPHMSDYQSGAPSMSHDQQQQPQPLMSNMSQDSLHHQHHQQQQENPMIDLNSRRPPHPYQGQPPPPQSHNLSQPGLPSAFQRLPFNHPNRDAASQDGYSQPSVITKVPPPLPSGGSDHSMPNTQQTDNSGNHSTSENVYGRPPPPQPDQYSRQQFSPHGYPGTLPYWDRNMTSGYNHPPAANYNLSPPPASSTALPVANYNLSSPPPASSTAPPVANYNLSSPPPASSTGPPAANYNLSSPPPASSTAPNMGQEQLPERPPERPVEEQPATKLWRPHTNGPQESTSFSSRPPSNVESAPQIAESNKTVSEQGQNKNSMLGSLLNKSPPHVSQPQQQGSSHPPSPAMSSSSHRGGESASQHSSFTSPRPPSVGGGNSAQHPLGGAGSPLQPPQTSPAAAQLNNLPPPSPLLTDPRVPPQSPHMVDSRVPPSPHMVDPRVPQSPHLPDPRVLPSPHMSESRMPLTSPARPLTSPRSTAGESAGDGMPSSMASLVNSGSSRGMNYMSMLNSDPTAAGMQMQEYLAEAERMRRTPSATQDLQRYMEMNGSRFGLSAMHNQSPSPYATHAMQQMGQSSAMYGSRLPMPATQPLPASFSSYGVAASPHLRQLLHNRIPGASGSQPGMMSHSAYATQSPLGMGLGAATASMYGGYDRQSPYSAGYNMQQAAELQYYQQRSQALHKSAAGYYQQPGVGSQYLDTQPPNPRAPYNPATMMGSGHLPPGYE